MYGLSSFKKFYHFILDSEYLQWYYVDNNYHYYCCLVFTNPERRFTMKALKFSRQRESIRECLKNRKDHPTADAVYVTISKEYPKISLGTVYRNLKLLADMGEIQRFSSGDGSEHFDYNTDPHYHLCARLAERSLICLWNWFVTLRIFSPLRFRDGSIPTLFSFTANVRTAGKRNTKKIKILLTFRVN